MKSKIVKLLASVSLCISATASAALSKDDAVETYRFKGDLKYAAFCEAILADDVSMMKKSVRREVGELAANEKRVLSILLSDYGVKCDGENLVEFSIQREAPKVHSYISNM